MKRGRRAQDLANLSVNGEDVRSKLNGFVTGATEKTEKTEKLPVPD